MKPIEEFKIEEFKTRLCADYCIEVLFHDILLYTIIAMKRVGVLEKLTVDMFDKIEFNYIQVASYFFYKCGNTMLSEMHLRSMSPNKADNIEKYYPGILAEFNERKETLSEQIKLWNANKLIDDERKFVMQVFYLAHTTSLLTIERSRDDFRRNDSSRIGLGELTYQSLIDLDKGHIKIFLTINGILKKIDNFQNDQVFIPDLEECLNKNGFEILEDKEEFIIGGRKFIEFIQHDMAVSSREYHKKVWTCSYKDKDLTKCWRLASGDTFISLLADKGVVTFFYKSLLDERGDDDSIDNSWTDLDMPF